MITLQELYTHFEYNPLTGVFIRKTKSRGHTEGAVSGTRLATGHIKIRYKKQQYLAHRLAWYYYYKKWPVNQIDHMNGDPSDNRIINLRESTQAENRQNQRVKSSKSLSPYQGITFCKRAKRWISQCTLNGKTTYVGSFDSPEDAYEAYLNVKRNLHKFNTL